MRSYCFLNLLQIGSLWVLGKCRDLKVLLHGTLTGLRAVGRNYSAEMIVSLLSTYVDYLQCQPDVCHIVHVSTKRNAATAFKYLVCGQDLRATPSMLECPCRTTAEGHTTLIPHQQVRSKANRKTPGFLHRIASTSNGRSVDHLSLN